MAWSTPMTATPNTPFTAAQWNAHRDNMLETAPAKFTAAGQLFVSTGANAGAARAPNSNNVSTSETTAATGFTDLTTAGPTVTMTTGGKALVGVYCSVFSSGAFNSYMGYEVSGATTQAADDAHAFLAGTGANLRGGFARMELGLTPGSNTFKAKYRVNGGTSTFLDRQLWVLPLS